MEAIRQDSDTAACGRALWPYRRPDGDVSRKTSRRLHSPPTRFFRSLPRAGAHGILLPAPTCTTCGHRQVVRHQLPKLTLAGSSPVARSRIVNGTSNGAVSRLGTLHGLEPQGREAVQTRERLPASVRGRVCARSCGRRSRTRVPLPAPGLFTAPASAVSRLRQEGARYKLVAKIMTLGTVLTVILQKWGVSPILDGGEFERVQYVRTVRVPIIKKEPQ